jgi:hypothetical protein
MAGLLWLFLAVTAAPPTVENAAQHGPVRLAVVPVIVASRGRPPTSAVFAAVWSAARSRINLAVMSEEEAFVSSATELSDHVGDCGPDTRCVSAQLRALGIGVGLMVVLNLDLDPPLVGLQLLDCERGSLLTESIAPVGAAKISTETLINEIRVRASKVFDEAGFALGGRLLVKVTPAEASVRLRSNDDRAMPSERTSASSFFVPPGRYRVLAALDGYEDGTGDTEVRPGEETMLSVVLREKAKIYESFWFWAVIGVAAAGATAAVVFATRRTDHFVCAPFAGADCGNPR